VQGDVFFTSRRVQLVLMTTRHAIPTIFAWREFVAWAAPMPRGFSRAGSPPTCRSSKGPGSKLDRG
jgi:hypothetical protein